MFCCFIIVFCLFVCVSGVAATTFYIFCTLLFITFQSKANSSCSNTQKAHLQPSDVKSPKPVRCSDAKSNVHSMNNIQASESFSISVCHRIGFSAVRACGNFKAWTWTDSLYKGCILHRPQSCAFFYAIEHKNRERNYQLITVLGSKCGQ